MTFCENCGTQLETDADFCGNCGTKNQASPNDLTTEKTVTAVEKKAPIGIIIGIAAVVAVLVIGFVGYTVFMNTGNRYLFTVYKKSMRTYQKELNQLSKVNPVLSTIKSNYSGSYTQDVRISGLGSLVLTDDKKSKAYQMNAQVNILPINFNVFITDKQFIIGSPDVMYADADPKTLGRDTLDFFNNLGIGWLNTLGVSTSGLDDIAALVDTIDFSYSSIQKGNMFKNADEFNALDDLYNEQFIKLIKSAKYDRTSSSVELGEKHVKTQQISLTFDAKTIDKWLRDDLLPALRTSNELKKYWVSVDEFIQQYDRRYQSMTYDRFLYEFEDLIPEIIKEMEDEGYSVVIRLQVRNGVIISVEARLRSEFEDEEASFTLRTLGTANRLDDIRFRAYDGSSHYEVSITGDHFSKTKFTSALRFRERSGSYRDNTERMEIEWDLVSNTNNLHITYDDETVRMTLAADPVKKEVRFRYDVVTWTMEPLANKITIPAPAMKLKNVTIDDLLKMVKDSDWYNDLLRGFNISDLFSMIKFL